jgi:hypothetical protein
VAHRNRFGSDASLTRLAWTTVVRFRCGQAMRKHIDVRMHFVREVVERGEFEVSHMASELNDADFLKRSHPAESSSRASARVGFVASLHEEER